MTREKNGQAREAQPARTTDIPAHLHAEEASRRRIHELGERFKELTCLDRLSNLIQAPGVSVDEIVQGTTALLPPAWQYPETACGRIILEGREFATENFRETRWRQSCDIVIHGERSGFAEVCYLDERPESDEGPFLKEERLLINTIAERLGHVVEHRRAQETLRASEATYRAIFNATNDGILVLDMETGEIVDANATFCYVFGHTPEEVRRLRLQDVSSGETPYVQEDALRVIHQAAGGQPQRFEWLAKSRDGALLWIDVTLKRATIAGRDRVLAVGRDITERKRTEEALRASEATYRSIFNATNDGILVYDIETADIVDANTAFLDRHGYAPEEARRLKLGDLMSGEAPHMQEDALGSIRKAAGGQPQRFEWPSKDRDGRRVWLDLTTKRATIAGQDRVLAIGRDITEHKEAQEALRKSERRYRLLAENAKEVIWTADLDLNFTYVSPSVTRLLGYTEEEAMALTLEQALPPTFLEAAGRALAEERDIEGREQKDLFRWRGLDAEVYHKDGSTAWAETRIGYLRDPDGQAVGILGVTRDITERRQAEEALREINQALQALIQASPLAILTVDPQGNVKTWSPAAERIFGWSEQEVLGRPNPIIPEDYQNEFRANLGAVLRGNPLSKADTRCRRKDGSLLDVSLSTAAMRNANGEVIGVMGIFADITDQKRMGEALRQAREELEARVERQMEKGNSYGLSFRELTVLHLVAAGKADKQIGHALGISPLTAHKHLGNILAKMGAASRTEAGVRALRDGLLN